MKYIMIPAMFALSMCTPVHAMDNQDCKYTKTVNQSEGQIVSSTTDYDCKTTPTVIVKENSPTVIYRTGTTVSSPVTTTRVVSSTPVYHNNHQTTNIITDIAKEIFFGGAAHRQVSHNGWVIQVPNRKKGACYATDDLRGTVCY
tara:strand:+ start:480 stop:911 length:432 start_codon:yes stop_codon:yes gene_type:complete